MQKGAETRIKWCFIRRSSSTCHETFTSLVSEIMNVHIIKERLGKNITLVIAGLLSVGCMDVATRAGTVVGVFVAAGAMLAGGVAGLTFAKLHAMAGIRRWSMAVLASAGVLTAYVGPRLLFLVIMVTAAGTSFVWRARRPREPAGGQSDET
jgi:hypothetical protein